MIPRPDYLEKLIRYQGTELVKVLTGVRRCGKSTLLSLLKEYLITQGVPERNILEVNFELPSLLELKNPETFYQYVRDNLPSEGPAFLFVDEIQELEEWAKTINGIRAEFVVDIYVTGSNSRMFVGEHLTYLSGRYLQVEVFPLSFREYLNFSGEAEPHEEKELDRKYNNYLTLGAFPAVALVDDDLLAGAILDGLYDSVFSRNIVLRGGIRNEAAFLRVARFALDNIGSQTSAHAIANTLKSEGHPIATDTVNNYLTLMCNAFLLYQCGRFDIRGKEYLRTNGKYYVVDFGLLNRVLGLRSSNRGHLLENMVYLELLRRGYKVSGGTIGQVEIDFVAQSPDTRFYVQVSETLLDEATRKREFTPFNKLDDGFPRIVISKDRVDYSQNGVAHINLYDFLLEESRQ